MRKSETYFNEYYLNDLDRGLGSRSDRHRRIKRFGVYKYWEGVVDFGDKAEIKLAKENLERLAKEDNI